MQIFFFFRHGKKKKNSFLFHAEKTNNNNGDMELCEVKAMLLRTAERCLLLLPLTPVSKIC